MENTALLNVSENMRIRIRAWLFCIISVLGIYASISNHKLTMVVLGLNILSLVILNEIEVICEVFFLLPFTMIYKVSPAATSQFTIFSFAVTAFFIFKNKQINQKIVFMALALAAYMLMSAIDDVTSFLKLITNIILAERFTYYIKRENFPKIVIFLSVGLIISCFIGLRKTEWEQLGSFYSEFNESYINGVKMSRFSALYKDPNYFSIMVASCVYGLMMFLFTKEIKPMFGIALIGILLYFGFISYSRMFYLALLVLIIMAFVLRAKITHRISSSFIIMFIMGGITLYILSQYGFLDNIMSRFGKADVTGNRLNLWAAYIKYLSNSGSILLFGKGIGATFYNDVNPHNFYIELLYCLGLIGGTLYLTTYGMILKLRKPFDGKRKMSNYLILGLYLFMFATLGMLFVFDFIYLIILAWMYINVDLDVLLNKNKGEELESEEKTIL